MFLLNELHVCDELFIEGILPAPMCIPTPCVMEGPKSVESEEYIWGEPARAQMEGSCFGSFSGDFTHFEQNHDAFPVEAQAVFQSITELRATLGAFRSATENICIMDEAVASMLLAEDGPTPSEVVEDQPPKPSEEEPKLQVEAEKEAPPDSQV